MSDVEEGITGAWQCELCEKMFMHDTDMVLECEFCAKHYCVRCLKYKASEYEAMAKPECMWFCLECKPKIEKNILNEKLIEERCLYYCQTVNNRLDAIEKELESKCGEQEVKQLIREAIDVRQPQVAVEATSNQSKADHNSALQESVAEINDQKAREANFLVFNAPEPKTNLKEVRQKADRDLIEGLSNDVCAANINADQDIVQVVRLGKKPTDDTKIRPLKVIMKDESTKQKIFRRLVNLRNADEKYKSLSIQHDQTPKQREDEKKLVEEARAKGVAEQGEMDIPSEGTSLGEACSETQTSCTHGTLREVNVDVNNVNSCTNVRNVNVTNVNVTNVNVTTVNVTNVNVTNVTVTNVNVTNVNVTCSHRMLKCFYTNADSLFNKLTEFQERVKFHECMIVAVTEVKPKNQRFSLNPAELALDGYDLYHDNITGGNGRGIALYIHKSLQASPLITLNSEFQESVWAEVKLNSHDSLLVGVLYRSPGSPESNNEHLNQMITEAVNTQHSHLLLLGDFNYPAINWDNWCTLSSSSVSVEYKFIENIRNNYLYQHVTLPTRGRVGSQANTLDLVFTNEEGMIDDITYESPLGKSDHSVLLINYVCYAETKNDKQMRYYYDKGDYTSIASRLDGCNWDTVLGTGCVNSQWTRFKEYMKNIESEYIPHRTVSNANAHKGKIPLDKASIRKIKKKHSLWKRFMETKDGERYNEYCRVRNQVRTLTRKLKKQFELNLATAAKSNPKAIWKYMNSKTKTREGVPDLNIDPTDVKSRLSRSDKEKNRHIGEFIFQCIHRGARWGHT